MLAKLVSDMQDGVNVKCGYELIDGILCYHGRIVFVSLMLQECHDTKVGGHSGFHETYTRIAKEVYWLKMKKRVRDYVASCTTCQQNKYMALSPGGLLQP